MSEKKLHPWRICPLGKHFVKEHSRKVKASAQNPNGTTSIRSHCAENPTKADQLYFDEIQEMTILHFKTLIPPVINDLGVSNGNAYDQLIMGWMTYWNKVFETETSLDFKFIKALIASESTFKSSVVVKVPKTKRNSARGLMQVTDQTLKILQNEKGEIKNHYITLTKKTILDPSANICAGIRWLFQKKKLAESKTKKKLSWVEVVEHYKGYYGKDKKPGLEKFNEFLQMFEKLPIKTKSKKETKK